MKANIADKEVVDLLANEKYSDWILKIREILQLPESPLSLKDGIWSVVNRKEIWQEIGPRLFDDHLDRFKQVAIRVLKEPDPKFELPPEERYMANIKGKVLTHSHSLRKGLAETLALLGTQPHALKNCSDGKAETVAVLTIREIFRDSDWILWASLDHLLPTLAEAAPGEFLSAVENALRKSPCPFDELFAQEGKGIFGDNYMTGLLWSLETLAWEEKYLVRVTVILGDLASHDRGGNWGNRPSNSLTTIFLPWLPQTIASVEKRIVAIHTLQKEFPEIAWDILLNLLPNSHQISTGSHKPVWRKTIPDNWEKGVSNKDYWDQISSYAEITVEMVKSDFIKLKELITNLDNLTKTSLDNLLEYLKSAEVVNVTEEERTPIWKSLFEFVLKHKRFKDAEWAFKSELIEKIEKTAEVIAPQKPQNLYNRLFTESIFDLYEESGNWKEQEEKIKEKRKNALQEIIKVDGLDAVLQFAEKVDSPRQVGSSLGFIEKDNIDSMILPRLLDTKNDKLKLFANGFVLGRYRNKGWGWINQLDTSKWTDVQIINFLTNLPFIKETWTIAEKLLGEKVDKYWSIVEVYPYEPESNFEFAIDRLMKHNRPKAAIRCVYASLSLNKTFNKSQAINALLQATSSSETFYSMDTYEITEIIKSFQNDPETNQSDLCSIEWVYLEILTGPGKSASPKLLEHRLASDPDFFCELISLLYRSKNKIESEKEPTEQQKMIAENAWKLLHDWKILPGKQTDGSFSEEKFNHWLDSVKTKCKESGHLEVALITIGQVLIHYIPDSDGLWINKALAEALNTEDAEKMRNGFSTGLYNSRGVYAVDPTGKPEMDLAAKYRQQAEEVENANYHRLATTLRDLADSYEREAKRIIEEHKALND